MIGGQNPNLPVRYGASYKSNTPLAVNTPETVFTPAANVNGAIVWLASFMAYNGSAGMATSMVAKSSAPTSIVDGDVILGSQNIAYVSTGVGSGGSLMRPVFIPAGKGLYFISGGSGESITIKSVLYTLL
jgi:hypothetical protein